MQHTRTVVIPDRNPSKVLVAGKQVQVSSVGGNALAVVVKSEDGPVRLRDTAHAVAPATEPNNVSLCFDALELIYLLYTVLVLVSIVTVYNQSRLICNIKGLLPKVQDVVHGVLAHGVSVGVEEPKCCNNCQFACDGTDRGRDLRKLEQE